MDYKEIIGYVTVAMAFAVYVPYLYTIVRGKTRPHLYTYLVDSAVNVIAFAGVFVAGAGAASWNIAASGALVFCVFALSFRYGTKDIRPIDTLLLVAALVTLIPWAVTHDPTISVVLITLIDALSLLPTLRKTWNDPTSEPYSVWGLNMLKHVLALFALGSYSLTTVFYPAGMVLMYALLTGEIILRRSRLR